MAGIGIAMLTDIEKTGAAAQTAGGVQQLITWGTNNPPKAWAEMKPATLFTDDPQTVLPFPAAPADPKLKSGDPKAPAPAPKKGPEPKKGAPPAKKGG